MLRQAAGRTVVFALGFGTVLSTNAVKPEPFSNLTPQERAIVEPAIRRYTNDEIKHDWSDLWTLDEQDIDTKRDFMLKDDAAPVPQKRYVELKQDAIASGGVPLMTSFKLLSVLRRGDEFLVSGCSAAVRESYHFKGIVEVTAHIHDGKASFGSWSFKYLMPQSCSQTGDSE